MDELKKKFAAYSTDSLKLEREFVQSELELDMGQNAVVANGQVTLNHSINVNKIISSFMAHLVPTRNLKLKISLCWSSWHLKREQNQLEKWQKNGKLKLRTGNRQMLLCAQLVLWPNMQSENSVSICQFPEIPKGLFIYIYV
jgi:hypothetical protein